MNRNAFLGFFGLTCLTASLATLALARQPTSHASESTDYEIYGGEIGPLNTPNHEVEHYVIKLNKNSGQAWKLVSTSADAPEHWRPIQDSN
jgi:hypothetical protein